MSTIKRPISTVKRQENNECLWKFFEVINSHYAKNQIKKTSKETTLLLIRCMLDLLSQLDSSAFSPTEKVCLETSNAYWLGNAQELELVMLLLCPLIDSKIHYRTPQQKDHRLACVAQVLSINKDHFDDLPEFFENIHLAGLPITIILKTTSSYFSQIPELKDYTCH